MLSSDQSDHLAQFHFDNVFDVTTLILADADDLVSHFDPAVFVGRSAADDLCYGRVAVLRPQRSANPLKAQLHIDPKLIDRVGRHVAGMRVEAVRQRRQIHLQLLAAFELEDGFLEPIVALVQTLAWTQLCRFRGRWRSFRLRRSRFRRFRFRSFLRRQLRFQHFVEPEVEQLELDALAPSLVHLGLVTSPLDFVRVDNDRFIQREIMLRVNQLFRVLRPLRNSRRVNVERVVGKLDIPCFQEVVQFVAKRLKLVDVRLSEVQLLRVQRFQESIEYLLRDFIIDLMLADVVPLDVTANQFGCLFILGCGRRELLGKDGRSDQQNHPRCQRTGGTRRHPKFHGYHPD